MAQGCLAVGIALALWKLEITAAPSLEDTASVQGSSTQSKDSGLTYRLLKRAVTNGDGRTDVPLLEDEDFQLGNYEFKAPLLVVVMDKVQDRDHVVFWLLRK